MNYNKNLLAENSNNPSRFWKIIKEIIKIKYKNATSCPLFVKAESKKVSDPIKKNILFLFHKCCFKTEEKFTFTQRLYLV